MNIIYSDIDTVWLRNPIPYLNGSFDIWSQMDLKSANVLCTGFLAIQSNINTVKFIKTWHNELKETPALNQPVFNKLVRKSALHIKALEKKRFPSGKEYFEQFSDGARAKVVVVHNWIIGHDKKLERFKKMKLWLNGTII
jgi:rhamnogalacturonan II specific xylosyltransferase